MGLEDSVEVEGGVLERSELFRHFRRGDDGLAEREGQIRLSGGLRIDVQHGLR